MEILDFSKEINYDLVSEIYYSCESLKLLNCVETKYMLMLLAKNLIPNEIISSLLNNGDLNRPSPRLRNIEVSKMAGEILN